MPYSGETTLPLEEKGDQIRNPRIPENYYMAELTDVNHYERDADSLGLVLQFEVEHDDEAVELPFFAPAKLSISEENESSRLGENLQRIGELESVLNVLGCTEEVMSEQHKWYAADEDEVDELVNALQGALSGRKVRVNVEDDQDGEQSQVAKLSKVFDGEGE